MIWYSQDFKKAYDSVKRKVLYNILIEFGVPLKPVWLIKMCLNEVYSKEHIHKQLSDSLSVQNGLNMGLLYCHCFFHFALEYTTRKVLENWVGQKLNGTH
jgi:hypothetical protein